MVGFIGKFQGLLFPIGGAEIDEDGKVCRCFAGRFRGGFPYSRPLAVIQRTARRGLFRCCRIVFSVNFGSDGNEYCDRSGAFVGITVGYLQLFPLIFE